MKRLRSWIPSISLCSGTLIHFEQSKIFWIWKHMNVYGNVPSQSEISTDAGPRDQEAEANGEDTASISERDLEVSQMSQARRASPRTKPSTGSRMVITKNIRAKQRRTSKLRLMLMILMMIYFLCQRRKHVRQNHPFSLMMTIQHYLLLRNLCYMATYQLLHIDLQWHLFYSPHYFLGWDPLFEMFFTRFQVQDDQVYWTKYFVELWMGFHWCGWEVEKIE